MQKNKWLPKLFLTVIVTNIALTTSITYAQNIGTEQMQSNTAPQFLYKILSLPDWRNSQNQEFIILSKDDDQFIHFSTEDQLNGIISKYWANAKEYAVLKVDANQLPGRLVYEANPGGTNKYYHLYDGSIPRKSIYEFKVVKK